MLLDRYGKLLPQIQPRKTQPNPGRQLIPETSDRAYPDVSRNLTPERVDSIMTAANNGDAADQAELAALLLEKSDPIIAAFGVRTRAVLGLKYSIEPGDDTPQAKQAAKAFKTALEGTGMSDDIDGFPALVSDMLRAVIVGYSLNEIIWGPGGDLLGFTSIDAKLLDFSRGYTPRIRVSSGYHHIEPDKYVFLHTREHGPDPVRGGLVRPLAWIHCFTQLNRKDLLSFTERYGMPFLVAKISNDAFKNELNQMLRLISSFGPNGGGVVTQGTEIDMIQAANNTGDIYFRVIEHLEGVVQRLLQGQTATSSDGGGLSKDNAQSDVRQDILEADAVMISECVNRKVAEPWCRFNFGDRIAPPKLVYDVTPPEDKTALGDLILKLWTAELECDPDEVSQRVGLKLSRRVVTAPQQGFSQQYGYNRSLESLEATPPALPKVDTEQEPYQQWLSPIAKELTALFDDPDITESEFAERLKALADGQLFGKSEQFEQMLEEAIYDSMAKEAVATESKISTKK